MTMYEGLTSHQVPEKKADRPVAVCDGTGRVRDVEGRARAVNALARAVFVKVYSIIDGMEGERL